MKKVLSFALSIIMAVSVITGMQLSAYAADYSVDENYILESLDQVKYRIYNYGDMDDDGDYRYDTYKDYYKEGSYYIESTALFYSPEYDNLGFYHWYSIDGLEGRGYFWYSGDRNETINFYVDVYDDDYFVFSATTSFVAQNYDSDKDYSFYNIDNNSNLNYQKIQDLANAYLRMTVFSCSLLLIDDFYISFAQLGFTAECPGHTFESWTNNRMRCKWCGSYYTAESQLTAPKSFTADSRTASSLTLSWSKVSGATGYQLQRKKTVNGELKWVDVAKPSGTSYTINSLSAGTLYYLRVRAYKGNSYSEWKNLTTCTNPGKTSAPSVEKRTTTSLKVKWNAVSKATSYEIQRKKTVDGEVKWVSLGTTSNLNYTVSGLSAGTCYYIRVRAIRKLDNGSKFYGAWSDTLTTCTNPSAPANFKVSSRTTTSLKLKWDTVSKATIYEVQRKKTVDGKLVWVSLGTTSSTNYNITGLSSGTKYDIRVRAIRKLDNGNKYYSDWKTMTTCTNPSAVSNLKADNVKTNSVTLKWGKVSKATNYEVQQKKTVNGKATWVVLSTPSATSYTVNSLSSGKTYNFRVRAFRKLDNGNKYFSDWKEISVKTK